MRWLPLGLASLIIVGVSVAWAQYPVRPVVLQNAVSATGVGTSAHVAGFTTAGVQVFHPTAGPTPTFALHFEASINGDHYQAVWCDPVDSSTLVTGTHISGLFTCNLAGMRLFRARVSAYSGSGSISVFAVFMTIGGLL